MLQTLSTDVAITVNRCCACVLDMFHNVSCDVATSSWHVAIIAFTNAIVSRLCCKSLCTCCICVFHMLRVFHANVSKLDLNFSMLQTLIFDVVDVESRCCKHVSFGVADIKF
jgi:hypothetical protein